MKTKSISADDVQLLKQDLKYYSESPINPLSAFSLSNGTLIATSATIITYLIVLIQFMAAENPNDQCRSKTIPEHSSLTGLNVTS